MIKLIHDYLNDSLSGQDLIKFKELMQTDKSFAEKVRQYKQIDDFLLKHHNAIMDSSQTILNYKSNGESLEQIDSEIENYLALKNTEISGANPKFKKLLDKIHREYFLGNSNNKPKKGCLNSLTKKLAVAVIIFILCICGIIVFVYSNKKYSSQELYTIYYSPYSLNIHTRGGKVNDADSLLKTAMDYFDNADYNAVIFSLNKLKTDSSIRATVNLISGQSFMGLKKYNEAISCFKIIIVENNSIIISMAEWYLGLCYLAINDKKNAKILFNKLSKNSDYSQESLDILKKLE